MSKTIQTMSITPMAEGYQATVVLTDGEQAKSNVFDSAEQATTWAIKYAENAQEAHDEPKSPEVVAGTTQTSQAPQNGSETPEPILDLEPEDITPPEQAVEKS